jgi:adenylylsulfate kinase
VTDPPKAENIVWQHGHVTREDREGLNGHKAAVLWFTGLSGSGKSTLANAVEKALHDRACRTYVLDGDNIRHGLNSNLGFSPEDRVENIRRISEVACLFVDAGLIVLTAFISPYRADRDAARALIGDSFHEIYVKADLETCEARDVKGLYKKARAGHIADFTGISAPYEEPRRPELVLDTTRDDVGTCTDQVIDMLRRHRIIPSQS